MSKSPAFLFLTKDWYLATAEMMPEEKGIYIDLLCFQHNTGSIPSDTKRLARIVGLDEGTFIQYWDTVKTHFEQENNRLVNQKPKRTVKDAYTRAITNKVNGSLPRMLDKTKLTKAEKVKFYKLFKEDVEYEDFMDLSEEKFNEKLTNTVNQAVNYIANANEDVNEKEEGKENNKLKGNHIFKNSPYHDFEKLKAEIGEKWHKYDLQHYYDRLDNADAKYQYKDWLRVCRSWILSDEGKGCAKIKPIGASNAGQTTKYTEIDKAKSRWNALMESVRGEIFEDHYELLLSFTIKGFIGTYLYIKIQDKEQMAQLNKFDFKKYFNNHFNGYSPKFVLN